MKKLPMITQRKKPDARFFTLFGLVALMLAVSYWGQMGVRQASVTVPVERVPLNTPSVEEQGAYAPEATAAPSNAAPEETPAGGFEDYRLRLTETRAASARMLDEVAANSAADAATVTQALREKTELAVAMQQEATIEALLAARGFGESLCTVQEGSVNVVVKKETLSDEEATTILDIASRETGADASQIRVIAEK